ncbi:MAG: MFS transporter, partial [Anaerolineales bacterium]|nr:MFS transporter [Anaerolineales bacterium]
MQEIPDTSTFRSYLFFWIGQLVSLLGSSIVQFSIIWYITILTQSPLMLAVASLVGLGTQILLTPIAGVYADRLNRKLIIGIVDFGQAIATMILIILFFLNIASL